MPTYEYACTSCGEHVEAVQSFSDAPLTECPACGGPLRKVYAAVGIVLKGSGFYRNDSRTGSKKAGSTSTGGAEGTSSSGGSDGGSEKKTETKTEAPAAKKEAAPAASGTSSSS
jgi:putative FmdB family regulatory protein